MNRLILISLILAVLLAACSLPESASPGPGPSPTIIPPTKTAIGVCMPNCGEYAITYCPPGRECPPDCYQCATHTPEIMCTPPACADNEDYFCPEERCPGGCGTVCATHTPPPTWWRPEPGLTFHIQYTGDLDFNQPVDVYNIDLMDATRDTVDQLHQRGVRVVCYFSAGTYEDWRWDASLYPDEIIGNPVEGWPGEYWIDIGNVSGVYDLIHRRLDAAKNIGCDAVDPDNVDGHLHNTGFNISVEDHLLFVSWMAREAHQRGLAIGLKNDLEQIPLLVDVFDFAVNEECFSYQECGPLADFIQAGKAVFVIEYGNDAGEYCSIANDSQFMMVRKNIELDAWSDPCWAD